MKKLLITIITGIMFLLPFTEFKTVNAEGMGEVFSVRPVLPTNQDPEVKNFFSLKTDSTSIKQELDFVLINLTKEPINLKVFGLNALTSPSGEIQYVQESEVENSKLLNENSSLIKYLKIPSTVELKPKEKKVFKVGLDVNPLTGTLLGSVGFQLETEKQEVEGQQFGIITEYRTVIGVLLKLGEQPKEKFSHGEIIIHPMSNQFTMKLPLSLNSENLIKDAKLTYEVYDKDNKELFKSKQPKNINFAPQSESSFFLPWESNKIAKNTDYKISGDVKYTDSKGEKDVYHFETNFKYSPNDYLDQSDESDNMVTEISKDNWLLITLSLILLLLLLALLLWRRFRNNIYVLNTDESEIVSIIDMDNDLIELLFPLKDIKKYKQYKYYHYYKAIKHKKEVVRLDYKTTKLNK